eukprot:766518-Hanusia_phi.AAC.11
MAVDSEKKVNQWLVWEAMGAALTGAREGRPELAEQEVTPARGRDGAAVDSLERASQRLCRMPGNLAVTGSDRAVRGGGEGGGLLTGLLWKWNEKGETNGQAAEV